MGGNVDAADKPTSIVGFYTLDQVGYFLKMKDRNGIICGSDVFGRWSNPALQINNKCSSLLFLQDRRGELFFAHQLPRRSLANLKIFS